ncbi:MAG: hypothetical protein NTV22_05095, partial [bacterium]|nr:hypothetical protein [bacterium]
MTYGNEGDPSRQNVGAVIKRTSNDDLVYAGIRFSTDGLDLQVKRVATSSHTVTKLWERSTTTNYNFYSTTRYDDAQNGRVFGVYCRNSLGNGNAIWCVTNVYQIANIDGWATSTITNGLNVDHRGGIVKNYDVPDGYIYVYGVTNVINPPGYVAPAVWRRTVNGGLGNWEPVVISATGGGEDYQTWVKKGNVFYSSYYGAPNGNWGHKWAYLTNNVGQIGIGGGYTNQVYGTTWNTDATTYQNIGAVLSGAFPSSTNFVFISTSRANGSSSPDVQAVQVTNYYGTQNAYRTMLGGATAYSFPPPPGLSNNNKRTECVIDDAYNGRAFFIFADYTNVWCATNIYANAANASNLFIAVVVNGMSSVRCSLATTTVKGKRVLLVSASVGGRKLRVYNIDTLNGSPIYTYVDITPSSLGNSANDRWSVGFAQMGATSTTLYVTWDNGSTTPQGNIYSLNLDNYDLTAIGIGQTPNPFPLLDLPGKLTGDRPVDLEVVDLAQAPAVTGGTLVVFSVVTNNASTQRGVF